MGRQTGIHYSIDAATGLDALQKNEGTVYGTKEVSQLLQNKMETDIVFLCNSGTHGVTVKTRPCKSRIIRLMEKEKKAKKEK